MSPKPRLIAIALVMTLVSFSGAHAQTPVDLISNPDFENPSDPLGFTPAGQGDGSVEHTTVAPIDGTGSMKITVNSYGRLIHYYAYPYGSGPYSRYVTLNAKLRVDSSSVNGRQLTACAVAYMLDSQVPLSVCQNFPVDAQNVVNVSLALDTNNRQLNYLFPQFALNDTGTIEATVDDIHYTVVEAQMPPVPSGFVRVDRISNNDFENSAADLAFEPVSVYDGAVAHTTTDPIIGTGSMQITVNSYGRVSAWLPYGYGAGPFARSVTLAARLRVDSSTITGRELTACAIAYFFDSPNPSMVCDSYPVSANDVDVYLSLDTQDRQLQYILPQFSLNDTGTIEATVDSIHFYVVQPQ